LGLYAEALWFESKTTCSGETKMTLDLYHNYQKKLRTGDLLSWSSESVLGWLIRKFTKSDINHSGMVIRFQDFEEKNGASRRFTLEALEHGIDLNLISRRLGKYKGKVYWHGLQERFDEKRPLLGSTALQFAGVAYDYRSLFKNILGKVSAEASKLFCSEYVYLTFTKCQFKPEIDDDKLLLQLAEGKAPTPADMHKLGWWYDRVKIF
jgi:hypothetical protein